VFVQSILKEEVGSGRENWGFLSFSEEEKRQQKLIVYMQKKRKRGGKESAVGKQEVVVIGKIMGLWGETSIKIALVHAH